MTHSTLHENGGLVERLSSLWKVPVWNGKSTSEFQVLKSKNVVALQVWFCSFEIEIIVLFSQSSKSVLQRRDSPWDLTR